MAASTLPPIKICILHGHGQSGQFFRVKAGPLYDAIRDFASKKLPIYPREIEFVCPDGPFFEKEDHARMWAYERDFERQKINSLNTSIDLIMDIFENQGPFVGVIGFSTGAALAAIVTSLLERQKPGQIFERPTSHPPLHFAVCFSGFKLGHPDYQLLYDPPLRTPIMHFIADRDGVIPEELTVQLVNCCEDPTVCRFEGTHYVPRECNEIESARNFICRSLGWDGRID